MKLNSSFVTDDEWSLMRTSVGLFTEYEILKMIKSYSLDDLKNDNGRDDTRVVHLVRVVPLITELDNIISYPVLNNFFEFPFCLLSPFLKK